MTSAFLEKIAYEAATARYWNESGMCEYMLAPSTHVTDYDVNLIGKSDSPLEAWAALLDVIHEASYADSWM